MKTTIEIADPLAKEARQIAAREGTTLRAVVEEGLRSVIAARTQSGQFRLEDGSVDGNGLQPGVDLHRWEAIRDAIYDGRGS